MCQSISISDWITITDPAELKQYGWTKFPSYVTAHPKLWQQWKERYLQERKYNDNNNED